MPSNIDPDIIGAGPVSKAAMKAQLTSARDEITALEGADAQRLPLSGGTLTGGLTLAARVNAASAATVDLAALNSNYVNITGTTTITSFGTPAGSSTILRKLVFAGALTLTHSANLILPTSANITTAAGDTAIVVFEGSSVWRVVSYQRADGTALNINLASTAEAQAGVSNARSMSPLRVAEQTTARVASAVQAADLANNTNLLTPQAGRINYGAAYLNNLVLLHEERSDGVDNSTTTTAGAWTARNVTLTETQDAGALCTISGGEFTLVAGTYEFDVWHSFASAGGARGRVWNVTAGAVVANSLSDNCGVTGGQSTYNHNKYAKSNFVATFAVTTTLRLEYFLLVANGFALGHHDYLTAGPEKYSMLRIMRITT